MLLLELITGCLPVNKIQPSDPDYENLAVKVYILSHHQLQCVRNRVIEVTPLAVLCVNNLIDINLVSALVIKGARMESILHCLLSI